MNQPRNSYRSGDHWVVSFWLIFDRVGNVRLTRGEPRLDRDERGMAMTVSVPVALFQTPSLRATMTIEAPEPAVPPIDLTAAADALKQSLGCDVEIRIIEPEAEESRP
jgi:hypothetical protein